MNLENVTYDAFISYRHCELDKFVAESIHKQLEAFKVPKSLLTAGKTNGKTKIQRVFRDRDELPLASNLANPITIALEQSDYLIVICSPRLPESKWCLKEIETFISLHGREHILAVLIEGEPIDSFPDILRFEEQTITDSDGNTHIEKIEVEPLAADIRGKNKKEVQKQIKNELLRLVAPMLDCNYDDLKMRHKEARQKKILRISLGISLVCFLFAAVSTTMALTIHKQSDTISEQYTEALKNQAVNYSSTSQTLLTEENRMAAAAIARMALPDSMANQTNKPYTPAAEYALSDSLGIYNNGHTNYAVKMLEQNSPINNMLISPEEDTVTTVDTNSQITIFDVASASILHSYTMTEEYGKILDEYSIVYLNNNQLAYLATSGYCIYDIPSQKETFYPTEDYYSHIKCSSDGKYIALSGLDGIQIFNPKGESLFSYELSEQFQGSHAMGFQLDKQIFAFSATNLSSKTENGLVGVLDLSSMQMIYTKEVPNTHFEQVSFLNDQIVYAGNNFVYQSDNPLDIMTVSYLYSLPYDKAEINWEYTKNSESINFFTGSLSWDSNTIVCAYNHGIEFINGTDGSLLAAYNTSSEVISIVPLKSDGYVHTLTKDGEKTMACSNTITGTILLEEYNTSNGSFIDYSFGYTYDAGYHRNATAVTIYQKITSDKADTLTSFDKYIIDSIYSTTQSTFLIRESPNSIYLYDAKGNAIIPVSNTEEYINDMFFIGTKDDKFGVLYKDTLLIYDTATGKQQQTISLQKAFSEISTLPNFLYHSSDGNQLAFYDSNNISNIYIYSIETDSVTTFPVKKESPIKIGAIGINENLTNYAIVNNADNTLMLFETESGKLLQSCKINSSIVKNLIVSEQANCIIISYLDNSVTVYSLSDLSILHTYTDFTSEVTNFDMIDLKTSDTDSPAPAYALYGNLDCYLLNTDFEPVAHLYEYQDFDSSNQEFILSCKKDLLSVPYYPYDLLIKEADTQLKNYNLSDYLKKQLGI